MKDPPFGHFIAVVDRFRAAANMDEDTIKRQEKKIDELTATVNRLSANFDAYAAQNPPAYVSV